jgi:hypothetical protein
MRAVARTKSPGWQPGDSAWRTFPDPMRCGAEPGSSGLMLHGRRVGLHARCPRVATRGFLPHRPQKAPGGSRGTPGGMPSRAPCDPGPNRGTARVNNSWAAGMVSPMLTGLDCRYHLYGRSCPPLTCHTRPRRGLVRCRRRGGGSVPTLPGHCRRDADAVWGHRLRAAVLRREARAEPPGPVRLLQPLARLQRRPRDARGAGAVATAARPRVQERRRARLPARSLHGLRAVMERPLTARRRAPPRR